MRLRDLRTMDALWQFCTARFSVEFHATEEDMDPADSFEFPDHIEFARSGDPAAWFAAWVIVRDRESMDIVGHDHLGGCSYNTFREFYTAHRDPDSANRNCAATNAKHVICHYFPGMVSQAIADARRTLAAQAQRAARIHA
jgi:hypothetical protein